MKTARLLSLSSLLAVIGLLTIAAQAHGQCEPRWLPGQGEPGVRGNGSIVLPWDPDGPGPRPEGLLVGGRLQAAGGIPQTGVAFWDGERWEPFAQLDGQIYSMCFYHGELIVCGKLILPGPILDGIVRWDGHAWQRLGTGLGPSSVVASSVVVYNGELITSGYFQTAGGVAVNGIARWDGSTWRALGTGLTGVPSTSSFVNGNTLAVWNNQLVVGGEFLRAGGVNVNNIARWDGSDWHDLGAGTNYRVSLVSALDDRLVVSGAFDTVSGIAARQLATWDGVSWQPFDAGLPTSGTMATPVVKICRGELICSVVTLRSGSPGGEAFISTTHFLRRTGSVWTKFKTLDDTNAVVMGVLNERLLVGGGFALWEGQVANGLVLGDNWDGPWAPLNRGFNDEIMAFTTYGGEIIAAGKFRSTWDDDAARIARWDGQTWRPLGGGFDGTVRSLAMYRGELIAAGEFPSAEGATVNGVARWDGDRWAPLGPGFSTDYPAPPYVTGVCVYNDELIACGTFHRAGNVRVNNIASWNGLAWRPLGPGLDHAVSTVAVYDGSLIAGGDFTRTGDNQTMKNIARWDGSRWSPMGAGASVIPSQGPSFVRSLGVYQGDLIAAGYFTQMGGIAANRIARWNGSAWQAMGDGMTGTTTGPSNIAVQALSVYHGDLIAGGRFDKAGTTPVVGLARWNGSAWTRLPGDLAWSNGWVNALLVDGDELLVGGNFLMADGRPSSFLARFAEPSACPADLNGDGMVEFADYLAFLDAFDAGAPPADFNCDGLVDFADYLEFLSSYESGC